MYKNEWSIHKVLLLNNDMNDHEKMTDCSITKIFTSLRIFSSPEKNDLLSCQ